MIRILDEMPKDGVVLVIADTTSLNLQLEKDILAKKKQKNIKMFVVFAPKYGGNKGDATYKMYERVSDGPILNLPDFTIDDFVEAVVTKISKPC